MQKNTFYRALLSPRNVALVGLSGDARKNTARPFLFMRKHGFKGTVYPVNASRSTIFDARAYPDLASLPGPVDHVFIMVSGSQVHDMLKPCAQAGAKVVTIYSDGFGEAGEEGLKRQDLLVAHARELGLRLLGPNSIGVADIRTGGIISVNAAFDADNLVQGNISMVSQSGSMMGSLLSRASARGFGFAKSISVGNESDITVGEVVDALVEDADTAAILLFLETIRDAPVLARALARAHAAGKPVIAYKLGRSDMGSQLSQSHTGAIAGNDAAMNAFFDAYGVIRVEMLETLFEIVPLALGYKFHQPVLHSQPKVAVITTTGGGAATVVDSLGVRGVQAVAPPEAFIEKMSTRGLELKSSPVIDLTLSATSAQYKDLLEQLLLAPWCDAVLSVVGSSAQFHPALAVQPLLEADKRSPKPLCVFLSPEATQSLSLLQHNGIAAFRTPEACADALAAFLGQSPTAMPDDREGATAPRWPNGLPSTGALTEHEAGQVITSLGIRSAQSELLRSRGTSHSVPYPVVVKISSRDIAHKTDVGGVRTGITDDQSLWHAVASMDADIARLAPTAKTEGYLVQRMESSLLGLILGYRVDELVGPIIILGAGGVAAELSNDVVVRLAPVTVDQAHDMILSLRITQLIRGYRGLPRGDCEALAKAISAMSSLALLRDVKVLEAEINPLFIQSDGVVAVDALIHLA